MGETSTLFDRILSKFIFYKARDRGLGREVTQGFISGHTLHTDSNKPLEALAEPVGSLIREEARKVYKAANNVKSQSGQVDLNAAGTGKSLQSVAAEVDRKVSDRIYRNIPRVKARRVLQEIQDEIIKKNNW